MSEKRLLIVSPHFPPVNAADMHRVRVLLPYLIEEGWVVEVLAVEPEQIAFPQDTWLVDGLPTNIKVHHVKAFGLGWSRIFALGGLGLRALRSTGKTGNRLLASGSFDLVYFSTTVFDLLRLGPGWKKKYGVPFVLDYQDPWVNDYYREHPHVIPPGGRLKYAIVSAMHRWTEPRVMRHCLGFTSVSPAYPKQLDSRYPWLHSVPRLVQPFPGAQRDFDRVSSSKVTNRFFEATDGNIHWVYIGVVIAGMYPALRALFTAITTAMPVADRQRLRVHFIGTSYAPSGQAVPKVLPLAFECGLGDQVDEQTDRIPYVEALRCLLDAHALLAIGSDDPGYTASKIFPYLLARKPLLAIYHEQSSITSLIREVGGAVCVAMTDPPNLNVLALDIASCWVSGSQYSVTLPLDVEAFEPYTDQGAAKALSQFFHRCLSDASKPTVKKKCPIS